MNTKAFVNLALAITITVSSSLVLRAQVATTPATPATGAPPNKTGSPNPATPPASGPAPVIGTGSGAAATGVGTSNAPEGTTQQMQPIIITGSAIPTTDTEGASPVTVINSTSIEQRGYQTAEDVIRHLSSNGSFSSPGQTSNNFAAGAAYVSLRGLGPQATLVLINGRRVTNYASSANGQYPFVDLNSIPAQVIDHIDVLTEGTALYGADAVAGVVNIVTKTNLGSENGEVDLYIGDSTSVGDAFEQRYTVEGNLQSFDKNGFGVVEADFEHQNAVVAPQLSLSKTPDQTRNGGFDLRSARTFPGQFFGETDGNFFSLAPGSGNTPLTATVPGAGDSKVIGDPTVFGDNPYNFNATTTIIPLSERYGVYANYTYKFYDGTVVPNIDFDYRHNRTVLDAAPAGTVIGDDNPPEVDANPEIGEAVFIVPATNPYNKTGEPIDIISYRFTDLGPRIEDADSDVFRVVPSVDIKLGDGWTLNAGFNYSYTFLDDRNVGFPSDTGFQNALNSTNPATAFNPFTTAPGGNSQSVLNTLLGTSENRDTTSLIAEDFRINGKVFDLPAGPVQIAFGGEYRLERFDQTYGSEDLAGNIISTSVQLDTAASQKDLSGYTEVDFPLTSPSFNCPGFYQTDVIVAGRVDKYSQFGRTQNPQVRLRWETIPGLVIRGGYSTAFRAPGLNELAAGGNQSFETVFDPLAPAGTNPNPEVLINSPGNPKLNPETAEIFSGGFAYSPEAIKGLLITADYFQIHYNNQIQQTSAQTLINESSPFVTRNASGEITAVDATYENLSSSRLNGADFGISYVLGDPDTNYGQFTFSLNGELLMDYYTNDGISETQNIGNDSAGLGPYSRYRQDTSISWGYHGFDFTVSNDYASGYADTLAQPSNSGPGPNGNDIERNVAADITFDLQASYEFDKENFEKMVPAPAGHDFDWRQLVEGTKITLGCNNVWNFTPPFTANPSDTLGYDPAFSDPTGRFIYAEISKKF